MPSRVVRGEINSSQSLSRVSLEADLTFRALIVAVDDFGRLDARPGLLKALLFPLRESVTAAKLEKWIGELDAEGCVRLYEVDGRRYLQLTGWEKHRGITKRAKSSKYPESLDPRISSDPRENPSESRGYGVESRESRVEIGAPPPASRKVVVPDRLTDLERDSLASWCSKSADPAIRARAPRIFDLEAACLDFHRANGNRKKITDWVAACRTWVRNDAAFHPANGSKANGAASSRPYPQPPPASEVFRRQREEEERRMNEH